MPTKKVTSTVNIKPGGAIAFNVKPIGVDSLKYAASLTAANSRRFGSFKFGTAKKFGASTLSSAGQGMPKLSTMEV